MAIYKRHPRVFQMMIVFTVLISLGLSSLVLAQTRVNQGLAGASASQVWLVKICDSSGANCGTFAIPVTVTGTLTVTGTVQNNGGTVTATPTGTTTITGTVTGTVQANQGTSANTTAGWPLTNGTPTAISGALTSASPLDTTVSFPTTGYSAVIFSNVPAGTVSSGTWQFEVSHDGGVTWHSFSPTRLDSISVGGSAAANTKAIYAIPSAAFTHVRVRINPAIAGTGTANVLFSGSAASRDLQAYLLNTANTNVTQYASVSVSTANPFIEGGRTSTSNAPTSATDGAAIANMVDKHGRLVVQYAPLSAQTNTTVDVTTTNSTAALAATANIKWAVYDWCVDLVGTAAGTLAPAVHLLDGSTTRDTITFVQTATTGGEPRSQCHHYSIPIQATTSAAVNIQATASAATTTIRVVVGAAQTGT